jgi:FkbM family methyltransferase
MTCIQIYKNMEKILKRIKNYLSKSLIGYFIKRIKEKWLTANSVPLGEIEYHGVRIKLDLLPQGMQQVIINGSYEIYEMKILPGFISKEDRVLEIGGALGFLGLFCKKVIGITNLVSVEPNPKTLVYLKENYQLNGLTPSVIEAALTPENGIIEFHISDMFWGDSLLERTTSQGKIKVEGLTFLEILKRCGFVPNVLIIDIEGAEKYIDFRKIPESINKILIEIHPDIIGKREAYKIIENLVINGFEIADSFATAWALKKPLQFDVVPSTVP